MISVIRSSIGGPVPFLGGIFNVPFLHFGVRGPSLRSFLTEPSWTSYPLAPGTRVGMWEILCPIGRGGSSHVYKAAPYGEDGPLVALKGLFRAGETDRVLRNLVNECRMAEIADPSLLVVRDAFLSGFRNSGCRNKKWSEGDRSEEKVHSYYDAFLVMELADTDLRSYLRMHGPLSARVVQKIFASVTDGLRVLHAHPGLPGSRVSQAHCDIKPENILRVGSAKKGIWKLADFGISVSLFPRSMPRSLGYTKAYLPPEASTDGKVGNFTPSTASDIWALGLTMHEALTGKLPSPIPGGKQVEISTALPLSFRVLIVACLEALPNRRPSAAFLHQQLAALSLSSRPVFCSLSSLGELSGFFLRYSGKASKRATSFCAGKDSPTREDIDTAALPETVPASFLQQTSPELSAGEAGFRVDVPRGVFLQDGRKREKAPVEQAEQKKSRPERPRTSRIRALSKKYLKYAKTVWSLTGFFYKGTFRLRTPVKDARCHTCRRPVGAFSRFTTGHCTGYPRERELASKRRKRNTVVFRGLIGRSNAVRFSTRCRLRSRKYHGENLATRYARPNDETPRPNCGRRQYQKKRSRRVNVSSKRRNATCA